jgi:uncharacterized membrane protein YwzB
MVVCVRGGLYWDDVRLEWDYSVKKKKVPQLHMCVVNIVGTHVSRWFRPNNYDTK